MSRSLIVLRGPLRLGATLLIVTAACLVRLAMTSFVGMETRGQSLEDALEGQPGIF